MLFGPSPYLAASVGICIPWGPESCLRVWLEVALEGEVLEGSGSLALGFSLVLFLEEQLVLWGLELFSEISRESSVTGSLKGTRQDFGMSGGDAFLRPTKRSGPCARPLGEGTAYVLRSQTGHVHTCHRGVPRGGRGGRLVLGPAEQGSPEPEAPVSGR